ncbi:MAG: hypothetical protein Ta2G_08890 [Termitinemataceae bacterium]|nr:MAG: hypothetical protein Ta2G_08890 [Termitinemataceae bacterium]
MSISRKAALSLFITVLSLSVFTVIAFTGLFDLIEARFYDPAVLNDLNSSLKENAALIDDFLDDLDTSFNKTVLDETVRRSFNVDQRADDILGRSKVYGMLQARFPGLQWVRFVDSNGVRIHFSTNPDDRAAYSGISVSYKSYEESFGYVPFDDAMLSGQLTKKIVFEENAQRILFYYPFYDSLDIYRGWAIFSVSIRAIADKLISLNRIKANEDLSIIEKPSGIVIALPETGYQDIRNAIAAIWKSGNFAKNVIDSSSIIRSHDSEVVPSYVLLNRITSQGIIIGRIIEESTFDLPLTMKIILLVSLFLSSFLMIFLAFNTVQSPVTVMQGRLKTLQVNLLQEYFQLKSEMDWSAWRQELELRRDGVRSDIKRGLHYRKGGSIERYIDSFFDKSWDDLLLALGSRSRQDRMLDEEKLEEILKRVLSNTKISLAGRENGNSNIITTNNGNLENIDEGEELDSLDEAEEIGAEEIDVMEEVSDIDDEEADLIEAVEELNELKDETAESECFVGEDEIAKIIHKMDERAKNISVLNLFSGDKDEDFDFDIVVSKPDFSQIAGLVGDKDAEEDENEAWQQLAAEAAAVSASSIAAPLDPPTSDPAPSDPPPVSPPQTVAVFEGNTDFTIEDDGETFFAPDDSSPVVLVDNSIGDDVASFDEATNDDVAKYTKVRTTGPSMTFENPHKGADVNAIAKKIEFSPSKIEEDDSDDDFGLDIDVSSPLGAPINLSNMAAHIDVTPKLDSTSLGDEEKPKKKQKKNPENQGAAKQNQKKINKAPSAQKHGGSSYRMFSTSRSGELEFLEGADTDDDALLQDRGGVTYIDAKALRKSKNGGEKIDQKMKQLVDSVLGG